MYDVIMCCSEIERSQPDELFTKEYESAKKYGNVHLFDFKNFDSIRLPKVDSRDIIYHGWMMSPDKYENFYNKCKSLGYKLINNPEQYKSCHYFNGWYSSIEELTANSIIVEIDSLRKMAEKVFIFINECNSDVIIKDYVKSLKHNWYDACFIPRDADMFYVCKIIANFLLIKKQENNLQGNLVVRKFLSFKSIGTHNKSNMPLAKEFRTFVLNGKILNTFKYWDQGDYYGDIPPESFITKIANKICKHTGSNFFTIDVAQLHDNSWKCIEVGDGQVSSIPEQEDKNNFFKLLLE